MSVKNIISNERQSKYAVIRNGMRVSDLDYLSKDEAKVITRWPDGSKLEIVEVKGK